MVSPLKSSHNNLSVVAYEDKPKEESFNGYFTINRRNRKGAAIYGTKQIND